MVTAKRDTLQATAATPIQSGQGGLDLALRHRYGDAKAFEEVYERFAPMVYNMALRLSGRADQADDLSQEIFLRIHRHLGRFHGRSTLKTWVYRVTINHCRSRLGRRRWLLRPLAEENDGEGVELEDTRRGPEGRVLANDAARRVKKGLQGVKPVFREAVVLRDLEELTYEEIAQVLGVRLGTVRSRIARGREQLRKAMEAAE